MVDVLENVIKYIKQIIKIGKQIDVNKFLCLIKKILKMVIVVCKYIINMVRPLMMSLILLANKKLEESKLINNTKDDLVNITNDDISVLIKLVTDKTINKNVYDKLIVKYNKKRIEKYNIYNNKIEDKNIKKNLDLLEKLIAKKLNIDDTKLFIVILLYYIKNSPHFS